MPKGGQESHGGAAADVKADCAKTGISGRDRVAFYIGGNRYRLVMRFDGTRAEYDRIVVSTVQEVVQ